MVYSLTGLALTERFEGCELEAYPDPATHGAPWTIGYGHTGPDVHPGLVWSVEQAQAALAADMNHTVNCVNALVSVPLSQGEFDALVDFVFNVGAGALQHSTLLRLLNAGDYAAAANEFQKWDRAGGVVMAGLLRRRLAEAAEFRDAQP
jgi:lysozyme